MLGQAQKLLTVDEAAAKLRVSRWSISRRVASGEIPALRVGSGPRAPIRIDEHELQAWLYREDGA